MVNGKKIHTDSKEKSNQNEYNLKDINKNQVELKIDDAELKGKFTKYLLFCLTTSVIGAAFQVGWSVGVFNNPINVIKDFFNQVYLDRYGKRMPDSTFDTLWSITNGLLPLGAAIGGIFSGSVADYFGRKNGMILTNVLVFICGVSNLLSKFVKSFEMLMMARFFSGLYCGLFTGILPLYLSEIPSQNLRGLVGTFNQITIVFGLLTSNILGLSEVLGTHERWPLLVGLMLVPILAHIPGLLFAVESPKHLYINKNKEKDAEEALLKLRGTNNIKLVKTELQLLESEKTAMSQQKQIGWIDLFRIKTLRRPLFVAIGIQISQQFSGINAVIFYSTKIFNSVGLEGSWPSYCTILLGFVQLFMTLVCMFIVEKAGRKLLFLIGLLGMCFFSFSLGICRIFGGPEREWLNYLTVISAVSYIVFFAIGPGPIPFVLTTEMFNSNARAKATSIAIVVNWGCAFIITVSFPFIEAAIGNYSFILFGILLIIFSLFALFFIPETKNKSIEEITSNFNKKIIFLYDNNVNNFECAF